MDTTNGPARSGQLLENLPERGNIFNQIAPAFNANQSQGINFTIHAATPHHAAPITLPEAVAAGIFR